MSLPLTSVSTHCCEVPRFKRLAFTITCVFLSFSLVVTSVITLTELLNCGHCTWFGLRSSYKEMAGLTEWFPCQDRPVMGSTSWGTTCLLMEGSWEWQSSRLNSWEVEIVCLRLLPPQRILINSSTITWFFRLLAEKKKIFEFFPLGSSWKTCRSA